MSSHALDAFRLAQTIVPQLTPFLTALAIASLVVLLSNSFEKANKVLFQAAVFCSIIAGSVALLLYHGDAALEAVWVKLLAVRFETRLCVATIVVGAVYFGGAMYIAPPDDVEADKKAVNSNSGAAYTPAAVDNAVTFEIPTNMPADDTKFFEAMLDKLTKEILNDLPSTYELNEEGVAWIEKMVNYTVAGGKMNRGLATVSVCNTLAKSIGQTLTTKERCQAAALGWCIEFLQAFFLVADDLMDDSVTRRGQPCWFRLNYVKTIAVNDSFILESFVYKILKRYFGQETYYYQLVDLFLEVTRQTEFGQLLDLTSQKLGEPIDLNRFTLARYTSIVKYKTAFYSFYLPVACGMIVHGITDVNLYNKAREILCIMGEYFQIQDDYLDCYGTPEVIGKIGTDIQDNKCSWLVVQALDRANPKQRKVLEENYGKHDMAKVNKVKKLYEEMNIEKLFKDYEEESYKRIQALLYESTNMPTEVFEFLLRKIYKRAK